MKESIWYQRAEEAQTKFNTLFWNPEWGIMNEFLPFDGIGSKDFIYWWYAHVIDVLVDAYIRTGDEKYALAIKESLKGTIRMNRDTVIHNFYDDMEWMALALLRAYDATGEESYKDYVFVLWEDIKKAWNSHMGGGMAWKKDQVDYKNTVANAPAAILAARLFQRFQNPVDLEWALRLYNWNKNNLVDPETGFVWDGLNREGDGKIDKDWEYTYCQGVFIGAGIELYKILQYPEYLEDAKRTATVSRIRFTDEKTGLLPNEGKDDCGLFKGIYIRYIRELLRVAPDMQELRGMIKENSTILWEKGMSTNGLISRSWNEAPEEVVQLSAQLSGIMLLEMMASLEE